MKRSKQSKMFLLKCKICRSGVTFLACKFSFFFSYVSYKMTDMYLLVSFCCLYQVSTQLNGPSSQRLSQFPQHEATRSIAAHSINKWLYGEIRQEDLSYVDLNFFFPTAWKVQSRRWPRLSGWWVWNSSPLQDAGLLQFDWFVTTALAAWWLFPGHQSSGECRAKQEGKLKNKNIGI